MGGGLNRHDEKLKLFALCVAGRGSFTWNGEPAL